MPVKNCVQSVGALRALLELRRQREETYFHVAVQAICLARMFQDLAVRSAKVLVRVMESPAAAPNSTYTELTD